MQYVALKVAILISILKIMKRKGNIMIDNPNKKIYVKGGRQLNGEVEVDGSKNSALVCMAAASLATDGSVVKLYNVPDISDIIIMTEILRLLGKTIEFENGVMSLSGEIKSYEVPLDLAGSIRGSVYCMGVLIGLLGNANCGLPGGDKIGERPIDIHLQAFEMMGAKYKERGGKVELYAKDGLQGKSIYLRFPSVGATCNIMLAAASAQGKTVIINAAKEPEIVDLSNLLVKMGVKVVGAGSDRITIYGSRNISGGIKHDVIADRIETGVFLAATTITGGEVMVKNCVPYHNFPLISTLRRIGAEIEEGGDDSILIKSTGKQLQPFNVSIMPFPGVATDLQPILAIIATKSKGESVITDHVFPERFQYIFELIRMGARIDHYGNMLKIQGGGKLHGIPVEGNDIRAVTSLICAGLIANGITEIDGIYHMERGYKALIEKLVYLGADIKIK